MKASGEQVLGAIHLHQVVEGVVERAQVGAYLLGEIAG